MGMGSAGLGPRCTDPQIPFPRNGSESIGTCEWGVRVGRKACWQSECIFNYERKLDTERRNRHEEREPWKQMITHSCEKRLLALSQSSEVAQQHCSFTKASICKRCYFYFILFFISPFPYSEETLLKLPNLEENYCLWISDLPINFPVMENTQTKLPHSCCCRSSKPSKSIENAGLSSYLNHL